MLTTILLVAAAPSPLAFQSAEQELEWSRGLGEASIFDRVESVRPVGPTDTYISGIFRTASPQGSFAARLDDQGNTLWFAPASGDPSTRGRGAVLDGAGGLIVSSSSINPGGICEVRRFAPNGSVLWSTTIDQSPTFAGGGTVTVKGQCAATDGAGGIYIGGYSFEVGVGRLGTIFHVDAAGNEVGRFLLPGTDEVYDLERAPNGDYAVANGTPAGNFAALFDADFNELWRTPLRVDGFVREVEFASDGAVFAGSGVANPQGGFIGRYGRLVKLDRGTGAVIWDVPAGADLLYSSVRSLAATDDGGVIAGGWSEGMPIAQPFVSRGFIVKIDTDGNAGTSRLFGSGTNALTVFEDLRFGPSGLLAAGFGSSDDFGAPGDNMGASAFVGRFNELTVGTSYCGPVVPNSTGVPASIRAVGSTLAAHNRVTLIAKDLPANAMSLFIVGSEQGFMPILGNGQGNLCISGLLGRYMGSVTMANSAGFREMPLDLPSTPTPFGTTPILAGETWNFQCWFRDVNPMPTSNATDAVSITFD